MPLPLLIEVWGAFACFAIPGIAERTTYSMITPSAAVGLLKKIYWRPGMEYHIDKIYVLSPIKTYSMPSNELKGDAKFSQILSTLKKDGTINCMDREKEHTRKSTTLLLDVHYVIEAHYTLSDASYEKYKMHDDKLHKRLKKGQCFDQPYFGCRDFPAFFREWPGGEIPAIDLNIDLGWMLKYQDYKDPKNVTPHFFRAVLRHGVLDVNYSVMNYRVREDSGSIRADKVICY